ncbi:MAG: DPP IV N-terminal domain-containing protein, partial [bacterium]
MIRKSKLNIILFILGLMAVGAMNTSQAQILTPEIVVEMKSVTSFAIQPQGDYVAYTLRMQRGPDGKPGGSYSEIWVVSTKTREAKQYTSQPNSASSPAWTPDGSKITFLSKKQSFDENTQVYAIPLNGGEARKLSHASGNIFSYAISPDGKMLAYRMRDTEEKEIKEAKKKGFDQKVIDTWTTVTRIHVENLANGKSRLVTEDDVHVVNFSWSPDGQNIIYRATNRPFTDDGYMYTDNYTVSAKGGKGKLVFDTEGKLGDPSYSPDGKKIAWLGATSFNDPATGSLFVIDASG